MLKATRFGLVGFLLMMALLAIPASALAAPAVTLAPASGPSGTTVAVRATGLTPNTSYLVQLVRGSGNVNTVRLDEITARTDANGQFTANLTVQQPAGTYSVRVVEAGGTIVPGAEATFTVTAGGATTTTAAGTTTRAATTTAATTTTTAGTTTRTATTTAAATTNTTRAATTTTAAAPATTTRGRDHHRRHPERAAADRRGRHGGARRRGTAGPGRAGRRRARRRGRDRPAAPARRLNRQGLRYARIKTGSGGRVARPALRGSSPLVPIARANQAIAPRTAAADEGIG